jgi:hypothetical protein
VPTRIICARGTRRPAGTARFALLPACPPSTGCAAFPPTLWFLGKGRFCWERVSRGKVVFVGKGFLGEGGVFVGKGFLGEGEFLLGKGFRGKGVFVGIEFLREGEFLLRTGIREGCGWGGKGKGG